MRARPREDGLPSVLEVNPAAQTIILLGEAGEELKVMTTFEKLIALAEQLCQERAAIVYRTWAHVDHLELVELYRAPSDGWKAPTTAPTEAF